MREDGAVLYPVRDGIPIMLIGEGIPYEDPKAKVSNTTRGIRPPHCDA